MLLTEIKQKKFKQKSNKNHDFRPKRESKLKAEHRSIYILSPSKPVNRLLRTKRSTQTHSLNNWILLTLWFIDSVAEYHVQQTINIVINIKLLCDIRFFQFFFFWFRAARIWSVHFFASIDKLLVLNCLFLHFIHFVMCQMKVCAKYNFCMVCSFFERLN